MSIRFRKNLRFLALLWILVPNALFAMHIIGGEMSYRCTGPGTQGTNRYVFTLKVYRDCNGGGAPFDSPAQMAIYRGSINNNSMFEDFRISNPISSRIIPDTPECVANIPNVCVEQAIYTFTRDLPINGTQSYFIVYQRCCRNVTISNLVNPGDIGATYAIELTPAAQLSCNNSPVFTDFPPVIICNNFALNFNHSATDADGDQLVYSFCSPVNGGGPLLSPPSAAESCDGAQPTPPCPPPFDLVTFTPQYSPGNPMGGNPIITINSATGVITGSPSMLGQFVVGVCVEEFRNGVLLSVLRRDFQFNVTDCSPTVVANVASDSILGPQRIFVKSCGSNTVTFDNQSIQEENIESFDWQFNLNGIPFSNTTDWDASITFPDTGIYNGILVLNPGLVCADTAFLRVGIYPAINANFDFDYDTCTGTPVAFTDFSTGEGGINTWSWNFGVPGGTSSAQNPVFQYPYPGNHPVRLRVFDQNTCSDDTTRIISWFPVPELVVVQPSDFRGCQPATITFTNLSTPIDSTYNVVWDFGDGTTVSGVLSPTHIYENPGVFTVQVSITSPIGCFIEDTFGELIRVLPSPDAQFTCDPDTGLSNLNNVVQFIDQSIDANRWNWTFGNFGTSIQQNPTYTFPDTGLVRVRLIVTHPQGCQDSLIKFLDIVPEVKWFMPNAFTPNGDGLNDAFFGKGKIEGIINFNMSIWNRWGEMVFETANSSEGWDGRSMNNGGMSPAGVYVYLVTFKGPRGENFEYKGFATVVF